jgi:hypothetical protein
MASSSTKQKNPSKSSTESELIGLYEKTSSTESELIGLYEKMGNILWARQFLEAQGYKITDNIVYQDNISTLSLAKNGHVLSSKCTKHIKAKYFFICHYHDSGDLNLRNCPTEKNVGGCPHQTPPGSQILLNVCISHKLPN